MQPVAFDGVSMQWLQQEAFVIGCRAQCAMHVQEDMYSYVTVADDQQYKGKGTEVVDA